VNNDELNLTFHSKVWDLRTGSIFETIHFDHAVTALQFDSRKIVAASGENGVKVLYILTVHSICSKFLYRYITVRVRRCQH
jgi:hypothetical protein